MSTSVEALPGSAVATAAAPQSTLTPKPAARNVAVDAYRGLVMFLMMAEVVQLSRVFRNFPTSRFWSFLAYHQSHVAWAGCSLHDTIQPGFSFLVGVAMPYSIASRIAKGGTFGRMLAHDRQGRLPGVGDARRDIQRHFPTVDIDRDVLARLQEVMARIHSRAVLERHEWRDGEVGRKHHRGGRRDD